jgi:formate dehydrogenase subunit delta
VTTTAKIDKLVHMANQIGDFYASMPEHEAIEGVATHLSRFWTPKMIRELVQFADRGGPGLKPTAARAVEALKQTATAA